LSVFNKILPLLRGFAAGMVEQMFYTIALFASLIVWSYTNSVYIAAAVGIISLALAWIIPKFIEGKSEEDKKINITKEIE